MTDNLPALVQPEPSREVAVADTDSWIAVAQDVIRLANLIAPTEFVPRQLRDSAPATAAAILYGREVGLPPMTALTMTHVIEGKPAMSAEAMRGLIMAAGHELHYDESTGARCVVRGRRFGSERWTLVEWTIDMARQAGLLSKTNWKSYPADMLVARATARLARMVFPDVIHGFRALEEFDDGDDTGTPELPAAGPTTKVSRAAKKAAARPVAAPPEERAERPSGPPLPGEDGHAALDQRTHSTEAAGEAAEVRSDEPSGDELASEAGPEVSTPGESRAVDEQPPGVPLQEPVVRGDDDSTSSPDGSEDTPPPRPISRSQQRMLEALLTKLDVESRTDRHDVAAAIIGRPVGSFNDLMSADAKTVLDTLAHVETREQLDAILGAQ